MSVRNVVHLAFDEFALAHGGRKKAGTWYLSGPDTLIVLHLQKSNYSPRYYLNFGIWFFSVGPSNYPEWTRCHLRARAESLIAEENRPRLEALLNLEEPLPDHLRHDELLAGLEAWLLPYIQAGSSLTNLLTPTGQRLIRKSGLTMDGLRASAQIREWPPPGKGTAAEP